MGSVRDRRNRFGVIMMRALLTAAALVALALGPFVVQCRAPNGAVAAKFLFSECSPEAGCCDLPEEVLEPYAAGAGTNSRIMDYGGSPCGGCSENALFLLVCRGSRDDGHLVGSISALLAEVHPASKLAAEIASERLADATLLEVSPSSEGTHRVLRI
jgi:hypothetical protein